MLKHQLIQKIENRSAVTRCYTPSMVKFVLSSHAQTVINERSIDLAWLERVLTSPERVESAKEHADLRHALGRIPEHGDRVLRVIYNAGVNPVRIVTAYFDRKLRHKL